MSKSLVDIQGFSEIQAMLKTLPDKVKKAELLKIMAKAANPMVSAIKSVTPVSKKVHTARGKKIQPGNLKNSIGKIEGKRGLGKENAVLYVGPRVKKGRWGYGDGWYGHMVAYGHNMYRNEQNRNVIHKKGVLAGKQKSVLARITQKNKGNVQGRWDGYEYTKVGYEITKNATVEEVEISTAKYIQNRIDALNKKFQKTGSYK